MSVRNQSVLARFFGCCNSDDTVDKASSRRKSSSEKGSVKRPSGESAQQSAAPQSRAFRVRRKSIVQPSQSTEAPHSFKAVLARTMCEFDGSMSMSMSMSCESWDDNGATLVPPPQGEDNNNNNNNEVFVTYRDGAFVVLPISEQGSI